MLAFLQGILVGLAIALSLGPAFIVMIQAGLTRGFKPAAWSGAGIILADVFLILVAVFGFARFISDPSNAMWIGLAGGSLLIVLGLTGIAEKKKVNLNPEISVIETHPSRLLLKTFLINNSNPFNWLFWIGISGYAGATFGLRSTSLIMFFVGILFILALTTILKAWLSVNIGNRISAHILARVNFIAAVLFVVTGIGLIVKVAIMA